MKKKMMKKKVKKVMKNNKKGPDFIAPGHSRHRRSVWDFNAAQGICLGSQCGRSIENGLVFFTSGQVFCTYGWSLLLTVNWLGVFTLG